MNILHTVESYLPARHGMVEVVRQISERLAQRGHQVTVATSRDARRDGRPINGVYVEEFAIKGNAARGITGEAERYRQFLLAARFDVITNFAAQQWATDLMLPLLDRITAKKVFVPTGFPALRMPEYKAYFEAMPEWMRRYDQNVFLSNDYRDANFARECGVEKRTWIPNGAADDEFLAESALNIRQQLNIPADWFLVLHVGGLTGTKGHWEAIEIFSRARIADAVLLLVSDAFAPMMWQVIKPRRLLKVVLRLALGRGLWGSSAPEALRLMRFKYRASNAACHKRIEVKALSRLEIVAAYKAADVFLFPSNIECSPIVLFECMASRTPFLTTDVGNAKEIIKWSDSGMLLPTRKEGRGIELSRANIRGSMAMLEEIYCDPPRRAAMAEAGFEAWQARFTWEKIAVKYESLYQSLR